LREHCGQVSERSARIKNAGDYGKKGFKDIFGKRSLNLGMMQALFSLRFFCVFQVRWAPLNEIMDNGIKFMQDEKSQNYSVIPIVH
jgi:hypothetical protein